MIPNTAPFDVTGHPATSVPAGLVDGLPAGLMIIGRHFDDATCLRVAHTFEQAVGGFPAPPDAPSDRGEQLMNGVHDLGGTDGLGPVAVEENEPVWHAEWEKAAFGMFPPDFRAGFFSVDMFRYGIEQMHPAEYLSSPLLRALDAHRRALHAAVAARSTLPSSTRGPSTTSSTPTSRCRRPRTPTCWRSSTPR